MKTMLQLICASLLQLVTLFSVSAQIPNASFEDWEGLHPQGWITSNNDTVVPPLSTVLVVKDTLHPFAGENAMMLLQNWSNTGWAETTFDNTNHPTSLTAYVKCDAYDTVSIRVEVLSNGDVVGEGIWAVSDTTITEWTKVTIPITMAFIEVFETRIHLESGHITGPVDQTSTLWVDSLSLAYAPVGMAGDLLSQNEVLVYPNPTDGVVHVESPAQNPLRITVYNDEGKPLLETNERRLDIHHFPKGAYYLKINTKSGVIVKEVVLE